MKRFQSKLRHRGAMSMPPSGVDGTAMDEEAAIEAEIQMELENINLDHEPAHNDFQDEDPQQEEEEYVPGFGVARNDDAQDEDLMDVPRELDTYIKSIQDQSSKFERELMECDDVLNHTKTTEGQSQAIIPYEDQSLLTQLAQDRGCTVEEYQRQILAELEDDEVIIEDELAGLIDDDVAVIGNLGGGETPGEMKALTEHGEGQLEDGGGDVGGGLDGRVEVEVQKAIEEGIDPSEVPVSQDLVPVNGDVTRPGHLAADIQNMLRNQLEKLEARYQHRIDKIKQDEACRRDEEEVQQRRTEEERQQKRQQIEREERQLALHQQAAQAEMEKQEAEFMREMQQSRMKFEEEMAELQAETELQRREHERMLEEEVRRQEERRQQAAAKIQARYRGYRVRKDVAPTLNDRREERKLLQHEERIKEVEVEIEKRKEEQQKYEQQKREKEEELKQLEEETKRQKEEEKRQKELEKKEREEEKRRLKEEGERKKQEEKKRKEEEKQRKKEEERKRKEEEKKRKEEEEQRKKEEKRLKEEEEKRKKEELKKQKEEEKRRKEEEAKQKKEEEQRKKDGQKEKDSKHVTEEDKQNTDIVNKSVDVKTAQENDIANSTNNAETQNSMASSKDVKNNNKLIEVECKVTNSLDTETSQKKTSKTDNDITKQTKTLSEETAKDIKQPEKSKPELDKVSTPRARETGTPRSARTKTPRSARKPKPPTPHKPSQDMSPRPGDADMKEPEKPDMSDCLPDHLEKMRLQFIKQCLPWSKVANEPWKLKAGVSKRPLRRPSSAKKLPVLADNIILDAAKVTSLKQVTTVQLCDLPGSNMSSLGQCWGLRYLSLTNCNLVALDGLAQCKQLQYLDAQHNKLEFVDVKDIGQLQYVNLAHNRLSSIHGLDNCTNLRWLDLSHNNITRLNGMETLRRLSCLKLHHNQLISTSGLGATPTLHTLDVSHNHLQAAEDLEKLCLLSSLDLSANNILQMPMLANQVLLQELLLGDNSLSSLDGLAITWLPLLNKLVLAQNSIDELPVLEACLLLRELDISNNQLLDADMIYKSIGKCVFLEQLHLEENPVSEDIDKGFYLKLHASCPRLQSSKSAPIQPRTSYETMCLTQCQSVRDIVSHFDSSLKSVLSKGHRPDLSQHCDVHYKFCDKLFSTLVEYRNAHEYGEVTVTVPSAPKTPKSRPTSARQKDKFMNPKDMFENALKSSSQSQSNKDMFENALKVSSQNSSDRENSSAKSSYNASDSKNVIMANSMMAPAKTNTRVHGGPPTQMDTHSDPRDLFEQALKSAGSGATKQTVKSGHQSKHLINGVDKRVAAVTTIQAYCRGWLVRHEIAEQTKIWLAATTIQAFWRGHRVRRITRPEIERRRHIHVPKIDNAKLRHLHTSATKIQALWRGYILRKKLLAALEYAQCDFSEDEEDQDAMDLNDEFDVDKFLDMDEDQLDSDDWKPPETPDIPLSHPVLRKPPSGKPRIPPIGTTTTGEYRPPSNPRRAWKNLESPLSDYGKVPHPPSSLASGTMTARSGMSRKEEKLTEEWGFKDTSTAHLMMARAKKMKYNAERRNKIKKLDPKQRLALFRKLEEVTGRPTYQVPQQKTMPRKEYFQARQEEVVRQEQEKREEFHTRVSRTFEWLHTQVGDHPVSDSVINQTAPGPRYVPGHNLPELQGGRVQLISSPILELQSVESGSMLGQRDRRFSAGSGGPASKLPPIGHMPQTTSAPTSHVKERMSFRTKKVNHDIGWGGGKKRTNKF